MILLKHIISYYVILIYILMKKIINLDEAEVLKTFKAQRSYSVLENKIAFKKVSCLCDHTLLFENNKKVFAEGQKYNLWIAQAQNKSTGAMFYFVALPKPIDDGEDNFYIVPQDVFGFVDMTIKPMRVFIDGVLHWLVVSPSGKQMLVPMWRFEKAEVLRYITKIDKSVPLKYQLIPRILGKSLNNMFPAWEIKKFFDGRTESFYLNVFTGEVKADWLKQNVFISVGNNQKSIQLGALNLAYRRKNMIIKF